MFGPGRDRQKKTLLSIILSVFVFVEIFGFLLFPRPAKAQAVTVLSDLETQIGRVLDDLAESLYSSALGALVQGASYFMRKLAYDSASYIASGGKGQGALVFKEGFGKYLEHVASDSLAETIDQFGKGIGVDLCKPPNVDFQIALKIGLTRLYMPEQIGQPGGPQPNCSWQELSNNWQEGSGQDFGLGSAANFADNLRVDQTDFGIALGTMVRVDNLRLQSEKASEVERVTGNGYKSVTGLISGNIKTPAAVIEEESKTLTSKNQGKLTTDQISGIYGAGAAQILPTAASVFMNTLVSKLLDQLLNPSKGLVPDNGESTVTDYYASTISRNRQAAQRAFNFLFTAVPTKQQNVYSNLVSDFANCPDSPGLNNCVIEEGLRQAIERARIGSPMTIKQALDEGLLHADWVLVSPRREADNTDVRNCYINKYCYSNLQKLRKVRILSLGFEIAALRSDPDQPWTLGEVVDGFDDCSYVGDTIIPNPNKPFCHLINPNWIIRSPEARCESLAYGSQLVVPNASERREECVDISTCINEGENGECLDNYYSYCTKEKNVWRFGSRVSTCDEQYATCRLFTNNDTSEIAAYLTRTLDYGGCNASNKGCLAYSAEKQDVTWLSSASQVLDVQDKRYGRNNTYYFNDNLKTQNLSCTENEEGCSAFYPIVNGEKNTDPVFFKKTPDYLGCYDTNINPNNLEIDWPETIADLAALPDTPECQDNRFAFACVEEEVGCQSYTPLDGGPDVPGITGANACDVQCVGYDTFKEEKSNFDESHYPLYFRVQDANTTMREEGLVCNDAYNGCEEFTNLEEGASGEQKEYFSYIKYCEDPQESLGEITNQKTFYSWEGSMNQGYVLKVHHLRPVNSTDSQYLNLLNLEMLPGDSVSSVFSIGSPAYADDRPEEIQDIYNNCNEETYKTSIGASGVHIAEPDCRALYDSDQNVYYRQLSKIITVDESCQPWRKTITRLYNVPELNNNKSLCEAKGGNYQDATNECNRCYNGGEYQPGAENTGLCLYYAIPDESQSCIAEANGCRTYTGSDGDNVQYIFADLYDTFEPEGDDTDALIIARGEWRDSAGSSNVRVVAESIKTLQYSLLVDASRAEREVTEGGIENQQWYELEFWARGVPQSLDIWIEQNESVFRFTRDELLGNDNFVGISDNWNKYTLGPVQFLGEGTQSDDPIFLVFKRQGNGQYFIDNVSLKRVNQHFYLIEDSWKQVVQEEGTYVLADVAKVCDSTPLNGLPGEALGCRQYNYIDVLGNQATTSTTGFEKLCRPEAVGCAPFIDTHNTLEEFGNDEGYNAFNVECRLNTGPVTEQTSCIIAEQDDWRCTVLVGHNSCFVNHVYADTWQELLDMENQNGFLVDTSIVIPADTPDNDPIYLTRTKENSCTSANLGCQRFGQETQALPNSNESSFIHTDTFIKNDPRFYINDNSILCRKDLVGCGEFRSGNTISYFKDPNLLGNKFCEYKEEGDTAGWFKVGIGKCANTLNVETGALCAADTDCNEGETCSNIGKVACYEDYFIDTAEYGIWSSGSSAYDNFVGVCPQEQHLCTELIDAADSTDNHPDGQSYYVIFNDQLTGRIGECDGKVSLRDGCVLFDKTDNANKLYSTSASYKESEKMIRQNQSSFVNPQALTGQNDANIILKVDRDRICSEWLSCKTSFTVKNSRGESQDLCYDYRTCREGRGGNCTDWVARNNSTDLAIYLDYNAYVTRNTSWYGEDYVGYSLFNKYQINDFHTISVEEKDEDGNLLSAKPYVVYAANNSVFGSEASLTCGSKEEDNWKACGFGGTGRCFGGNCVYPIDGSYDGGENILGEESGAALCKVYPESTSPFPTRYALSSGSVNLKERHEIFEEIKNVGYSQANICQDGECSCSYKKITYENGNTDYWSYAQPGKNPPTEPGICTGGDIPGYFCVENEDCYGAGGTCTKIKSKETHIGLVGYCLEYDLSRPIGGEANEFVCLTWLPIDSSASLVDNYNNDQLAGYYPAVDAVMENGSNAGKIYCTDSNSSLTYDQNMLASTNPQTNDLQSFISKYFPTDGVGGVSCQSLDKGVNGCNLPLVNTADSDGYNTQQHYYTALSSWAWAAGNMEKENMIVAFMEDSGNNHDDRSEYTKGGENFTSYLWDVDKISVNDIKKIYFPIIDLDRGHCGHNIDDSGFHSFPCFSKERYLDIEKLKYKLDNKEYKTGEDFVMETREFIDSDSGHNYSRLSLHMFAGEYTHPNHLQPFTRYGLMITLDEKNDETNKKAVKYWLGRTSLASFAEDTDRPGNFYTIVYDFDSNGNLAQSGANSIPATAADPASYISKGLNQPWIDHDHANGFFKSQAESKWLSVATMVELMPKCTEFSQVYMENPSSQSDPTNKAWTDRVWQYAKGDFLEDFKTENFFKPQRENYFPPYGALSASEEDFNNNKYLLDYTFFSNAVDAIPWGCQGKMINYPPFSSIVPLGCAFLNYLGYKEIYFNDFGFEKPEREQVPSVQTKGKEALNDLFAKIFKVKKRSEVKQQDQSLFSLNKEIEGPDISGDVEALPPKIYSPNPETCFPKDSVSGCTIGTENAFAVNKKDGHIYSAQKTGFFDINPELGLGGEQTAILQFFAEADKNHMPIRRVMVDWGDGTEATNQNTYGLYKNHLPDCADTDESAPHFGLAPRACEENLFTFVHDYTCNDLSPQTVKVSIANVGTAINPDVAVRLSNYNLKKDYVCVFEPKVQVLDNWGWCNGSCNGSGNTGCYSERKENLVGGIIAENNECQVDEQKPNPWTHYSGTIIVIP